MYVNETHLFSYIQVFEQIPDGLAMKAMADSLFFWGYAVSPIPGGFLASMVPAHRVFGLAICASVVLNMTIPGIMLLNNVTLLVIVRGMQGVFEVITDLRKVFNVIASTLVLLI